MGPIIFKAAIQSIKLLTLQWMLAWMACWGAKCKATCQGQFRLIFTEDIKTTAATSSIKANHMHMSAAKYRAPIPTWQNAPRGKLPCHSLYCSVADRLLTSGLSAPLCTAKLQNPFAVLSRTCSLVRCLQTKMQSSCFSGTAPSRATELQKARNRSRHPAHDASLPLRGPFEKLARFWRQ